MPVDAKGNVQMDYLPIPVIGTFWPYSADKNVKLTAVKAAPRRVLVEQTALTVAERFCGVSMIVIQRFTAAELSTCSYFDSS